MIVERLNNEILIRIPSTMTSSRIQSIMDYLRYEELTSDSIATQEDIGKITKAVEDVKKQFTIETEILKNNLSLYSGSFQSIKTLERNASRSSRDCSILFREVMSVPTHNNPEKTSS